MNGTSALHLFAPLSSLFRKIPFSCCFAHGR